MSSICRDQHPPVYCAMLRSQVIGLLRWGVSLACLTEA